VNSGRGVDRSIIEALGKILDDQNRHIQKLETVISRNSRADLKKHSNFVC